MEYEPDSRRLQRRWGSCGAVAEWSKALAWKVSIRQKRIEGSNPSRSANIFNNLFILNACMECVDFQSTYCSTYLSGTAGNHQDGKAFQEPELAAPTAWQSKGDVGRLWPWAWNLSRRQLEPDRWRRAITVAELRNQPPPIITSTMISKSSSAMSRSDGRETTQCVDEPGYTVVDMFGRWQPFGTGRLTLLTYVHNLFDVNSRAHTSVADYTTILDFEGVVGVRHPPGRIQALLTMPSAHHVLRLWDRCRTVAIAAGDDLLRHHHL